MNEFGEIVVPDYSRRQIPNKRAAIAVHRKMRAAKTSPVHMGRLYVALLARTLWPTQAAMAEDLGISRPNMCRAMETLNKTSARGVAITTPIYFGI